MSTTRPMAAVDAQMFWMSATVPNDQFLLYSFDGSPRHLESAIDELRCRAGACEELRLRVIDDSAWRYPKWTCGEIDPVQFTVR